jgi:hypothetical protein
VKSVHGNLKCPSLFSLFQYMCGAPERLPAFGARTFSTVIPASVVQDLNEKVAGVDCMMR